jgi:hypothetical protein
LHVFPIEEEKEDKPIETKLKEDILTKHNYSNSNTNISYAPSYIIEAIKPTNSNVT